MVILALVWFKYSFPDLCAETLISKSPSPNKKLKAIVHQIDCGATTGFNSHVSIIPITSSLVKESKKFFKNKSFFVADTDHGKAPAKKGQGPEIKLYWQSNTNIDIKHHINARVIRAEKSSNGVTVEYHTFE